MAIVRTSSKYQIAIPKRIRAKLGIKAGQRLSITERDGGIFLAPLLLLLAAILTPSLICSSTLADEGSTRFTRPDALVLVLGGFGPSDQCSINYTTVVALPKAQADLDAIAAMGKWKVSNAKGETKSSGGPNPMPTTSISFQAKGIIGYANGTLPLEPFVTALRRFKFIEIGYLVPAGFAFHGLEDFENEFVKLQLAHTGNSYRYRVVVKDAGFAKLDLPLMQPAKPKPAPKGMPLGARVALAVGLAALGAGAVYFVAAYILKRR